MGLAIEREDFTDDDRRRFEGRLADGLGALRALLARPGFGEGEASIGAELELCLVDAAGRPSPVNLDVLAESLDPRLTFELDRFNLECNLRHGPLAGRPFAALEREMRESLREVERAAALHASRVAAIGILPTLEPDDLASGAMTDTPRFRALSRALRAIRSEPFHLRIDGADPLDLACDDVTFEGAATSLQVHLRVAPRDFARFYNAAQIATVAAVAVAGNSPTLLGHRLWQETRVALFKQAVDARTDDARRSGAQARVSFGTGWCERGAIELFEDSIASYAPLLPVLSPEDPAAVLRDGGVPRLEEVRLHQGTVWRWNRPVYDPAGGGHVRIELRALPAGPSVADMVANAAFLVGLTYGIAEDEPAWRAAWPFERLHGSFYRAAQAGLDAEIAWPAEPGAPPRAARARDVAARALAIAERGLARAGVEAGEAAARLDVVARRVASGRTGARWQLAALDALGPRLDRRAALAHMLDRYVELAATGAPVHAWPVHGEAR
ncbi:MAG: glutamate--cysteine ligase [Myxococcota bacterium]